ncbi:MAG TPA: hypothetical protein VK686_19555, partial [Bryobacteraceae bacterium]|nr:hypothetical protein [Bryobacteraceae bacterium]
IAGSCQDGDSRSMISDMLNLSPHPDWAKSYFPSNQPVTKKEHALHQSSGSGRVKKVRLSCWQD